MFLFVRILAFISSGNFKLNWDEHENSLETLGPGLRYLYQNNSNNPDPGPKI